MSGYLADMALILAAAYGMWAFHVWQERRAARRDPALTNLRARVARGGAKSWHPNERGHLREQAASDNTPPSRKDIA